MTHSFNVRQDGSGVTPSTSSTIDGFGSNKELRLKKHYQDFVCGFGAAVTDILVTYPIHKLIFRQQLHGIVLREALHQLHVEGLSFLYRGLLPPLIQKTSSRALMFGTYAEFQRICDSRSHSHHATVSANFTQCHAAAAFMSGTCEALLTPLERVQVLLQNQNYHSQLKNTWHAFVELRAYGLREYYRGVSAILLRNGPSNVVFFGLREPIKDSIPAWAGGRTFLGDFAAGAFLGATLSTILFPLNVTKARMQSTLGGDFVGLSRTFFLILRERDFKLKEIFRGVHVNFTRSIITWGITNASYEFIGKVAFHNRVYLEHLLGVKDVNLSIFGQKRIYAMNSEDKFKSSATLRLTVKHFSTVKEAVYGDVYYVRGLPWRISFSPESYYSSGLSLICDAGEDFLRSMSCRVVGVLRLVPQKEGVQAVSVDFDERFTATDSESSVFGLPWDDISDSEKGYVKDDVAIFEASFTVSTQIEVKQGQFQQAVDNIKSCPWRDLFPFCARFHSVIDSAGVDKMSDVTLVCQGKSFNCHRIILAQKSTTFDTQFSGDFKEANNKQIVIEVKDISGEILLEVLRFIYCGYVETNLRHATPEDQYEFLYAADKYDLKRLTHLVVLAVEETLNPANVCKYLLYADEFSLTPLKFLCFTVMANRDNRSVVWDSPEFVKFIEDKKLRKEFVCFDV